MSALRVPYPKFGTGIGLHRVSAIAAKLGLDLAAFGARAAVITGSNGKGSTAAMLASILAESGAKVGRFTSPHLFKLNERFWLNGADIDDETLALHWERVRAAAQDYLGGRDEELGGFEFLFLVAADWLAAQGCDATVWEAGIGGRYDPVRLIQAQRTSVVSLDLEHTSLLGKTLEEIAFDKLDAASAGASVFLGEDCGALGERITSYCALRGVGPVFVDHRAAPPTLPLAGLHQRNNAALAIAMAQHMDGALSADVIARGLAATRWPGRLEIISESPLIVIDVGHTPAAIALALDGFARMAGAQPPVLVCGASVDKSADEMIMTLARAFPTIIAAQAVHKGRPAEDIARVARAANGAASVTVASNMADAHARALKEAASGAAIYVAGGLFLAAEFKAVHLGLDPDSLAFF